jgi:hypothetical protein
MARAADAIRRISAATGYPVITVLETARFLRADPDELWPRGEAGARKSGERVDPRHLTNMLIALLADSAKTAPNLVREVRAYQFTSEVLGDLDWDAVPPAPTFGASLDSIISALAAAPDRKRLLARIDRVGLARRQKAGSISMFTVNGYLYTAIFHAPEAAQSEDQGLPIAPVFTQIGPEIFDVFADLVGSGTPLPKKAAPAKVGTQPARYLDEGPQCSNTAEKQSPNTTECKAWPTDKQGFPTDSKGSSSSIGPPAQSRDEKPCTSRKTRKQAVA